VTIFSDRGAWYGWEWGDGPVLLHVNLAKGERRPMRLSSPPVWKTTDADGMSARLEDGSRVSLRYVDARATELLIEGGGSLVGVPVVESGLYRFEDERIDAGVGEDLSGIPATLRRNWRVPGKPMPFGGIVPSPAGTQELRAYDAFLAAAALPTALATKLLRAVLAGQDADGSLRGAGEMPLAAWACSKHPGLLDEFRPELTAHARWWEETRRQAEVVPVAATAGYCRERRLLGRPDEAAESDIENLHFIDGDYRDAVRADPKAAPRTSFGSWAPLACGLAAESRASRVTSRCDQWEKAFGPPVHDDEAEPLPGGRVEDDSPAVVTRWDEALLVVEGLARYDRGPYAEFLARILLKLDGDRETFRLLTDDPTPEARPQCTVAAAVRTLLAERYRA